MGHPVAKAQRAEVFAFQRKGQLHVATMVEGQRQIDRAAREKRLCPRSMAHPASDAALRNVNSDQPSKGHMHQRGHPVCDRRSRSWHAPKGSLFRLLDKLGALCYSATVLL